MQNPNPLENHFEARNQDFDGELREEEEEEDEEEDYSELEESVVGMAQQILEYRNTFPDQLKTTLASILDSQIPILPPTIPESHESSPGKSRGSTSESSSTAEDPEMIQKLERLKQKISSNASAIPVTLRRMRECMDQMDKLQSRKCVILPAFKKKRLTD